MTAAAQDDAILPAPDGTRKVVLATSIAETSLTIDGVHVVVDSGLARVPSFSPRTGMSRLETVRVSRASAEQRSGRAGRVAPGVCYRLWAAEEHAGLLERDRPEILQADLAPFALDLAVAGVVDASSLRWLDPPPAPALAQARELLVQLGAIDGEHRITSHGRAMASFGVHPRLAHMMLRGHDARIRSDGVRRRRAARRTGSDAPRRSCPRRRHPASSGDHRGARAVGRASIATRCNAYASTLAPGVRRFASHRARPSTTANVVARSRSRSPIAWHSVGPERRNDMSCATDSARCCRKAPH